MTNADSQHAAETVEILVAFIIPDVCAFAFHQRQRLLVISRDCREKKLFVFADGFGLVGGFRFGCAHVDSTLLINDEL